MTTAAPLSIAPTFDLSSGAIWAVADPQPDSYAAFRAAFALDAPATVTLHVLGAAWYQGYCDQRWMVEGPDRFPLNRPEYQTVTLQLAGGAHELAFFVHHAGVSTRMLLDQPPFLWCRAWRGGEEIDLPWRAAALTGYASQVRRINPQLAWVEWADTRQPTATDLVVLSAPGMTWTDPVPAPVTLPPAGPSTLRVIAPTLHELAPIAQGPLATPFGYERDDPSWRFFAADRRCVDCWPEGRWWRFDLGRVRLGRASITLDAPAGTVVEFAYAEALQAGVVSPCINWSAGTSCNLDHYVARGGVQTFTPLTPRGGRYVEVHATPPFRQRQAELRSARCLERVYYPPTQATFRCEDDRLNRIWEVGVATYRGCAEDALVDNPTRERGQWMGDVATVGMAIGAVAYHDLDLIRRGLLHAALCAREDGLVAGLCPGGSTHPVSYALQWITAMLHYHRLTGDASLLHELHDAAERNLTAVDAGYAPAPADVTDQSALLASGLGKLKSWTFIDWGYDHALGHAAYELHYLEAVESMIHWCALLHREATPHQRRADELRAFLRRKLEAILAVHGWDGCALQDLVLAARLGFFTGDKLTAVLDQVERHYAACYPNDRTAPRAHTPTLEYRGLITPYFAHYSFPEMLRHGRADFVLEQTRRCWGWMLECGVTTWMEVFEPRWTHCHQWAGCPTWQLSRYGSGLWARYDLAPHHFELTVPCLPLQQVEVNLPIFGQPGKFVRVRWDRQGEQLAYRITSDHPLTLALTGADPRTLALSAGQAETLSAKAGRWL